MALLTLLWLAALCRSVSGAPPGAGASVPYDANTHVPVKSAGCGKESPYPLGRAVYASGNYGNVSWKWLIYLPKNYNKDTPLPVIFQHPGWTMSAQMEAEGSGINGLADPKQFISVTPQGMNDNSPGVNWYSWNAGGTSHTTGPGGPTCTAEASDPAYCYNSCGTCVEGDELQCSWTTCENTVTPTGTGLTSPELGFIPSLYDTLEDQLCIDTTREFNAGESNGGIMSYQTCAVLAGRLAACAPQFGSFARGYNIAPDIGVALIDTHGTRDTTVPANVSLSSDGYYYTTTHDIFNGNEYNSKGWKASNNCTGEATHYPTAYDGLMGLYCVKEGTCSGGDVVRCAYDLGHNWFNNGGAANGGLITDFLLKWSKPTHVGNGHSKGESVGAARLLTNVKVAELQESTAIPRDSSRLQVLVPNTRGHYGDPRSGCLGDEDVVMVATGYACAPRIGADHSRNGPPKPRCKIGGTSAWNNSCPVDANVDDSGDSFPICLGKDNTTDAYDLGDFHCLLVCPCSEGAMKKDGHCSDAAHDHCPKGARCEREELRQRSHGVCTYPRNIVASTIVV